jgi:nucleotide-binding universal stress UspA family protein
MGGDMSTILAAVDDSAAAAPVVATARAIAPLFGAATHALHVADAPSPKAMAAAESQGVPLRTVTGNVLARLAIESAQDEVLAVVCGTGRAAPRGERGQVALALAGTLEKPIVAVPPEAPPLTVVERLLMAIKGNPKRARALKRAVELVDAAGLDLLVVHVDDEESIPSFSDQVHYETELYAQEFLARYVLGAPSAKLALRVGVPADEILATARELDADVLAVGWPHTTEPGHGEVARAIVQRSPIPVVLVATD